MLAFTVSISPWLIRNYITFNKIEISSNGFITFYRYAAKPLVSEEELREYHIKNSSQNNNINDEIRSLEDEHYDLEDAEYAKKLALSIIRNKWNIYLYKTTKNILDFPFSRGKNILTEILNLDYKYYRGLEFKKKIRDFDFVLISIGASYDILYKIVFYILTFTGICLFFFSKEYSEKKCYLFLLIVSFYFVFITSATMLNDLDLPRLILPAQLGLIAFIPPAAMKLFSRS